MVIDLWNALQLASPRWNRRKPKALAALRTAQRGRQASPAARARFDMLTARWRREFDLDPRLVASWTYEPDAHGQPRLTTTPRWLSTPNPTACPGPSRMRTSSRNWPAIATRRSIGGGTSVARR